MTDDHVTAMRAICSEIAARNSGTGAQVVNAVNSDAEQALDDALREARNDALEEAARVCDELQKQLPMASLWVARGIANRIRALKSTEQ